MGGSRRVRDADGQVMVMAVGVIVMMLALLVLVVDVGNWFVHHRHLQTEVDAAALAGGQAWSFPCNATVDAGIESEARKYVGSHRGRHIGASSTLFSTSLNNQVGGNPDDVMHVVLNGPYWSTSTSPADYSGDGAGVPAGSVCNAATLQVDATEHSVAPLFGSLSIDLHAKARVALQEIDGLSGLLPIAVRTPKPQTVAAASMTLALRGKTLLDVKVLREATVPGLAAGLGGWTDSGVTTQNMVTIPTSGQTVPHCKSFSPACSASAIPPVTTNCVSTTGFSSIDDFCRQGGGTIVTCYYATGAGATQTAQAPLAFVRGYTDTSPTNTQPPQLESVWLSPVGCADAYFNATAAACTVQVNAHVDTGGRAAGDVEVGVAGGSCGSFGNKPPDCALTFGSGTTWATAGADNPSISILSNANPFSIRIRLRKTTVNGTACGNSFPNSGPCVIVVASPVQQTVMGSDNATGPIKYVRLTRTDPSTGAPISDPDPGSDPVGASVTYSVDVGLRGAVATTVAESPYAFNLKGSQSGLLDCDPDPTKGVVDEVVQGCAPKYSVNKLTRNPPCPSVSSSNQFFNSPPAPYSTEWPPYTCVLTQTGNPTQLLTGFSKRIFGVNNASSCPSDSATGWVKGRNYWSNANNMFDANTFESGALRKDDPRLITLFLTGYGTFTGTGNETFPIVSFGAFYVTGWGQGDVTDPKNIDDPCPGNTPPPDLIIEPGGAYVWGHFINTISIDPNATTSGKPCRPGVGFNPCVATLVE